MTLSRWIASQVEAGSWVRRMFAEGQRLRALHGEDAVADLALGQPLGDPSEEVRAAIAAAVAERQAGRFAYMPNLGYPEVRERVAATVPGVGASSIVMTGGAGAAISLALRAFVDPGDEVLGFVPHFGEYAPYCSAAGAQFVPVPATTDRGIDPGAVAAALTERTRAVILNTPNNPSGHVATERELRDLAAVLQRHGARTGRPPVLVVDEVYHRLVFPPAVHHDALRLYTHTVLARSFSKDLGLAGERIGYLVLHPELASAETLRGLELCQRALGFVNAPATMQRMLLHLRSWDVDLAPYLERRDHAVEHARAAGLDVEAPQGGLYLFARVPSEDGTAFAAALAERCVLVAPGIAFGMPQHLRICFTAPREAVERAMAAVREIGAIPA